MQQILGKNDAPPAVRASPPGWRDPRLWVGVVIVAVSVVAGARILGAADDTIGVWEVSSDLAPGDRVEAGDLVQARVGFAEPSDADRYLRVDDELPDGLVLTRGVGAGELLPRAALGTADDAGTVSLSVSVPGAQVPTSVAAGSHVDVWIMPAPGDDRAAAELAVEDVAVIDSPSGSSDFGSSASERQLVLGIPEDTDLSDLVLASGAGRVMLVGRG